MSFDPTDPVGGAFQEAISQVIDVFLDEIGAQLNEISPTLAPLADAARTYCRGGKRFRPGFGYWGYVAAADQPDEPGPLLRACAGFELLHVGVLAHDDVLDGSDTRRGLPSAHRRFEAQHRSAGGVGSSADYGKSQAVILGDELIVWADQLVSQSMSQFQASGRWSGLNAAAPGRALKYWRAVRTEVNAGQFLDIANQYAMLGSLSPAQAAELVLEVKTARYTVIRPLQFGAALAGADDETLAGLQRFASPLGRAFQLRDDLLGVFADRQVTGKPAGDDLREGKATVLVAAALASSPDADELAHLVGDRRLSAPQIDRAREIIVASGADQVVEARISADAATARAALAGLSISEAGRTALSRFVDLCTRRER